jgi:hypothetical protein
VNPRWRPVQRSARRDIDDLAVSLLAQQGRNVWPNIRDFTFRLDELHSLGAESWICVIVPWDSIGQRADGAWFSRPGRATLLLSRRGDRWVATHSHCSLAPLRG